MNIELYAFWEHQTHFPYVLGGPVTEIIAGGKVATSNYGQRNYFDPIKLVPVEEGQALYTRLMSLANDYREAKEKLRVEYDAKLNAIAPFIK